MIANKTEPGGVAAGAVTVIARPARPRTESIAVQSAHPPEIITGREQIRRDHEIGAGDALKQQHTEAARESRIGIDVELVSGHLRIGRIGPVEEERKRNGGTGRRRDGAQARAGPEPRS